MITNRLLPRLLEQPLDRAMNALPVVVVSGARQTGKSTLVRELVAEAERAYLTLDDLDVRDDARSAPEDLVRRRDHMTLDEVQRVPNLLLAIKRAVDERREPGRFLLTGSANLLLMKSVSESLAGRALYLTLWPLTRRELLGLNQLGDWSHFIENAPSEWLDLVEAGDAPYEPWTAVARRGGYPTPAHQLTSEDDRRLWFDGYIRTYLERDLQQLTAVEKLADFRRLMRAATLRVGGLLNQADLARDVALAPSTAQRYLNLLEVSYQMVRVPAYSVKRTKRLTKSPKLYWSDTGLAMHLAGETSPRGVHMENMILCDLLVWRDAGTESNEILHWRTTKGAEVDFVIETAGRLLPIEVKSSDRVRSSDVRNLKVFLQEYSDLAPGGLVLYDGNETFWIADRILAAPWWKIM